MAWGPRTGGPGRITDRCDANLRAHGTALRFSSSPKLQGRRRLAADAGVDRLGQRRDGRGSAGQWSAEDPVSAVRTYGFYFFNHQRKAWAEVLSSAWFFDRCDNRL